MATLASVSAHSWEGPPFPRLPVLVSESLRSGVSSKGSSTQGVVSVLLSTADVAKLDLSNLQLFSGNDLAMEPMAKSEVVSSQTEMKASPDEDFAFHTPLILGPAAEKVSAEHQMLKVGTVSPSPRARKKAVSMDETCFAESLDSVDVGVSGNVTEQGNGGAGKAARARVRAEKQLPGLQLAALPPPGLEQRAETLRKKHLERVLSRSLSEARSRGAKIDVKASPATEVLLQVMPWEPTSPVTPVRTPTGIPFIWEDVPGRPKPHVLPSPSSSLPLPPRLLLAPPPSSSSAAATGPASDSAKFSLQPADGEQVSPAECNPLHGPTHRKNTHSWHVLHNFVSGSYQRCSSHGVSSSLEDRSLASEWKNLFVSASESSRDGVSSRSTSFHSNSTSFDFSPSPATASKDAFSSCESSLGARYELPPIYVAPIVPLTPPHRDLGPLEDECGEQANGWSFLARLFSIGKRQPSNMSKMAFFFSPSSKHGKVASYLLDDANGVLRRVRYDMQTDKCKRKASLEVTSGTRKASISAQMSPTAASLCRSPKPSKPKIQISSGKWKMFLKLRTRAAGSYRAIKQALLRRRASHSRLFNHTQLPYQQFRS